MQLAKGAHKGHAQMHDSCYLLCGILIYPYKNLFDMHVTSRDTWACGFVTHKYQVTFVYTVTMYIVEAQSDNC